MDSYRQNKKKPRSYARNEVESRPTETEDASLEYSEEAASQPSSAVNIKDKHRFWIGITALITIGLAFFTHTSTGRVDDVKSNGIGKGMEAGIRLAASDDSANLEARDFEIEMKANRKTSRMLIWDFAAEDGDVVTVKVDGNILQSNIGIMNKPVAIDVPVPSVVEIVGVKDGGGGITYGVKFPGAVHNSAYFNAAPVNSSNAYKLTGQ